MSTPRSEDRKQFDVLVIGPVSVDIVFSGMSHWPKLGQELYVNGFAVGAGSIFNTAATLSKLGLRVGLLTEIGNDFFSRYILEEIEKVGIARDFVTVHDLPMRSVSICLAHDGERGFVSYADVPDETVIHLLNSSTDADHPEMQRLHERLGIEQILDTYDIGSVFIYLQPNLGPLLDRFTAKRIPIYFDTGWHAENLVDPRLRDALQSGRAVMPNRIEAITMTGAATEEEAVRKLARWIPTAIVKVGELGVLACQDDELVACPAFPIDEVVDTTGAGDAFNAGFIYGSLKGYSLVDALRCGTICGSLSTTAHTGTAAVPSGEELEHYLQEWQPATRK